MLASAAQSAAVLQVSAVVEFTSATVPLVPDMLIVPVASVGGRSSVPPAPAASPMRYVAPVGIDPFSGVTCQVVVAPGLAEMYCTDQPATDAAPAPRLPSSMKSFFSVAPEFPPPPYTSLRTTAVDGVAAAGSATVIASARPATVASAPAAEIEDRRTRCPPVEAAGAEH